MPTLTDAPSRETPDVETSSEGYARRFAGPVGAWFLELQAEATLALLASQPGASVLDVGGGHGQIAGRLAAEGHAVTVLGSKPVCVERIRALVDAGAVRFDAGDLLAAPYPEDTFDVVVSYRLLPHVSRWQTLAGELCRLARRAVIVDYPTRRSVNAVADGLFKLKKGIEGNTRPFTVFADDEVEAAFAAHGFGPTGRCPQFFFPMALHRATRSAGLGRALEGLARGLGLTRRFGSPVILRLEPGAS